MLIDRHVLVCYAAHALSDANKRGDTRTTGTPNILRSINITFPFIQM